MNSGVADIVSLVRGQVQQAATFSRNGRVASISGLIVESEGPNVGLGELCVLRSQRNAFEVLAEVVGFRSEKILLMALGDVGGLHVGCETVALESLSLPVANDLLLGRVLDALGRPMDEGAALSRQRQAWAAQTPPPHPLRRQRISEPFLTGVKAIDAFTPLGRGQRMGIFAGSGVGKSTLLGMIARGSSADVVVIGLVGERGREVREFIERDLGPDGLKKSVVVVATSDAPAPMRLRAAFTATALAESYRDQGRNVLLLMDSVTRFAMAQREIGLAVGEPPATRGYTPSVFALLPRLLERSGAGEIGAITALYTVLVEGDDMNEPVADTVRGILDGHLVLSRALAHANHYPAIDILESISRLGREVAPAAVLQWSAAAREQVALYRRNEDLINIGAYNKGSNPALDHAIRVHGPLQIYLRQSIDEVVSSEAMAAGLKGALG
jgi:flagellum-specific ATP synthase